MHVMEKIKATSSVELIMQLLPNPQAFGLSTGKVLRSDCGEFAACFSPEAQVSSLVSCSRPEVMKADIQFNNSADST